MALEVAQEEPDLILVAMAVLVVVVAVLLMYWLEVAAAAVIPADKGVLIRSLRHRYILPTVTEVMVPEVGLLIMVSISRYLQPMHPAVM